MRALVVGLALLATPAVAQEGSAWVLRGDLGWASIHGSDDQGPSLSLRFGRAIDSRGVFSVDVGANGASADEGFVSGVLGVELRTPTSGKLSLFLRAEGGVLYEESAGYPLVGVGGGLSFRLKPNLSLRASALWSGHSFDEGGHGPTVFQIGIERRW